MILINGHLQGEEEGLYKKTPSKTNQIRALSEATMNVTREYGPWDPRAKTIKWVEHGDGGFLNQNFTAAYAWEGELGREDELNHRPTFYNPDKSQLLYWCH